MINIFNSPIEPTSLDEFADEKKEEGVASVFDKKKQKPKVTYNKDGRRMIDGVVENQQPSNALWSTTITRGVANEWREEASGNRLHKTRRYLNRISYDTQVAIRQTYRKHSNELLALVALILFVFILMYIYF